MGEHHERKRAKRPGRLFLAACATLIAALASSVARAQEQPVAVTAPAHAHAPRNKLALVAGLGSPWGELGAAYQRALGESFAIETGVGYGLTGAQAALLPKLLIGSGKGRFYIQAGPSLTIGSGTAVWAAGEIGGEFSFGRWVLTCGGGAGVLVDGSVRAPGFAGPGSTVTPWFVVPETRLSFGRAF
jgi:hypothetical protein